MCMAASTASFRRVHMQCRGIHAPCPETHPFCCRINERFLVDLRCMGRIGQRGFHIADSTTCGSWYPLKYKVVYPWPISIWR
jgi:hypothetical protein